ncbi:hypothetical protein [Microbacterium sp. 77mftsu3.1]|uniref:hypothetical protein n=1 Tax=Microbacterium sp. 77mftsu3.1 TaxID=1761802 RepID=UPI0003777DBC|nr:hypothetical protein [Microbacterium sp. 77mftsu3.1]SDH42498.1 hypothetical protein SAMN04488590_3308 [Microbacterium sp. 77mftsu3.1]
MTTTAAVEPRRIYAPARAGGRFGAKVILEGELLNAAPVTIDFSRVEYASQGFFDEVVKEAHESPAESVRLAGVTRLRHHGYLELAIRLHEAGERVTLEPVAAVTIPVTGVNVTRWAAEEFARTLGLLPSLAVLDFTDAAAVSQGFCDELVAQLDRGGATIGSIIDPKDYARTDIVRALALRGLPPIVEDETR